MSSAGGELMLFQQMPKADVASRYRAASRMKFEVTICARRHIDIARACKAATCAAVLVVVDGGPTVVVRAADDTRARMPRRTR